MSDSVSPQEAPRQPYIIKALWDGSTAEIYNPGELYDRATTEGLTVYDRADFGTPIERARLSLEPVTTSEGEVAVGLSAHIQLDRSAADIKGYVKRFTERFRSGGPQDRLEVSATSFYNCFIVRDHKNNVDMMVTVYDDGSIHATNQRRAVSIEPSDTDTRMVEIHAPAVQAVDEQSQLRGVSRIFMKTLDVANSVTTPDRLTRLKRTYHIGDQPRPLGYTTHAIKSLGAHTIRGAVGRPEQLENTADRLSDDELKKEIGISVEESRVLLEDIGGLRGVKAKLYDIATSFTHPGVMKRWGAERPQGVLLYGEPGTGKTMLVEALANAIGAKLWRIQSSDIYDQWIGSSEAKIKELFRQAQAITEPTIILFDEFDSIVGTSEEPSSDSGAATRNSVSGIFKQEMNDLAVKNPNVLVAATTNSFDRIDGALIRSGRFDHKLLVPMPDTEGRAEIMAGIIGKAIAFQEGTGFKPFADGIDINRLAEATDGMSGADLNELFRRIRFKKAMQEALTGSADPISHEELEATIRDFRTQG